MNEEQLLLGLWKARKSMSEIAVLLGTTRAAIAGRISRARKRGIMFEQRPAFPRRPPAPKLKLVRKAPMTPIELNETHGPRLPISLFEHAEFMCRAVIPYKGGSAYCSWPRMPGRSYCATCDMGKSRAAIAPSKLKTVFRHYRN